MKMIKKHLNWSLLIGVVVIESPIIYLLLADPYAITWSWVIPVIIAELALEVGYLYQKRRSYVLLLLNFIKPYYIPVGFILLLCLSNKRTEIPHPEDKVML